MKIKKGLEKSWAETLAKNKDSYGAAVMRVAVKTANRIERKIAAAEKAGRKNPLADAQADWHAATTAASKSVGLSGFQYQCVLATLRLHWEHSAIVPVR